MLHENGMTYPEGSCEVACDLKCGESLPLLSESPGSEHMQEDAAAVRISFRLPWGFLVWVGFDVRLDHIPAHAPHCQQPRGMVACLDESTSYRVQMRFI